MNAKVNLGRSCSVRLRVLPGSARIQVIFPNGRSAMCEPSSGDWHCAGKDEPLPAELLRTLTGKQSRKLVAELVSFHAARLRRWNLLKL